MAIDLKQRLKQIVKNAGKKVVGATSSALAAPWTFSSYLKQREADNDVRALKGGVGTENAPTFDEKGNPTEGFKAWSAADSVKQKLKARNKGK